MSNTQQIKNISKSEGNTILYLPRVHMKHSSRDIRSIFVSLGIGINISVDLAYNPATRFNMAFVFIENSGSKNLETLRLGLNNGQDIRIFPQPEKTREFWMILPSNADHEGDEAKALMSNDNNPKIQLDVNLSPVNSKEMMELYTV